MTGSAVPAIAQETTRLELTVLGGLVGGGDLGDRRADALGNQAPTSPPSTWFTTSTRVDAAPTVEGRIGVRTFGRVWVEGGVSYARPEFVVDIAQDVEGAANTTATSRLTQVLVDGALQYRWAGRRISPFVLAGGGYLRQLDDTRATAETGWLAQAGGGLIVRLAPGSRGFARRIAVRGDVRVVWLRDGVILEKQRGATFSALIGVSIGL